MTRLVPASTVKRFSYLADAKESDRHSTVPDWSQHGHSTVTARSQYGHSTVTARSQQHTQGEGRVSTTGKHCAIATPEISTKPEEKTVEKQWGKKCRQGSRTRRRAPARPSRRWTTRATRSGRPPQTPRIPGKDAKKGKKRACMPSKVHAPLSTPLNSDTVTARSQHGHSTVSAHHSTPP